MMNIQTVSMNLGGKTLTLETGRMAKQADASVLVHYGDTRVLVTAVSNKDPKPGIDFMPLTVEFAERFYAAGKIPGSFLKREGRPSSESTLAARLIDRPNRPLFPEGYYHDTQIIATVLSAFLWPPVRAPLARWILVLRDRAPGPLHAAGLLVLLEVSIMFQDVRTLGATVAEGLRAMN